MEPIVKALIISICLFIDFYILLKLSDKLADKIRLKNKQNKLLPSDGNKPMLLGLGNAIGFTMYGEYERLGDTYDRINSSDRAPKNNLSSIFHSIYNTPYVGYCFFVVCFLPIIPLGCYAYKTISNTQVNWKKTTTTYRFYGKQKWNYLELIHIYIEHWSFAMVYLSGISIIICLFDIIF